MSSVFNNSYIEAVVKNQCCVVKCPFGSSFASCTYELELSGRLRVNDIWGDVFMITINHVPLGLERAGKNCTGYALTGANKSFCSCQFEGVQCRRIQNPNLYGDPGLVFLGWVVNLRQANDTCIQKAIQFPVPPVALFTCQMKQNN